MLEQQLELEEIPKLISFCDHLLQRQIKLYQEFADTFRNVYTKKKARYLGEEKPLNVAFAALGE